MLRPQLNVDTFCCYNMAFSESGLIFLTLGLDLCIWVGIEEISGLQRRQIVLATGCPKSKNTRLKSVFEPTV
jgi:hypothetical protein